MGCWVTLADGAWGLTALAADLPQFVIPGLEADAAALNDLHARHHPGAFSDCTLWDGWLPQATLWASAEKRARYRESLLRRRVDDDGYVSMQQHRGMAHSEGWPFPAWQQSTGRGFHFASLHDPWAVQYLGLKPLESADDWEIRGGTIAGIDPTRGLELAITEDTLELTTPAFRCGTIVAPFARLEWAGRDLPATATAGIEWLLEEDAGWPVGRSEPVALPAVPERMSIVNVPLYRRPDYAGVLLRYRVTVRGAAGARLTLQSVLTAIDTRHPITNSLFVRGSCDYWAWTGDRDFLRQNIDRMRIAIRFALNEFGVRTHQHVLVPWVGHDGSSGLVVHPDGHVTLLPGRGVGNNYWDLLPFGGHDALATMYLFDALRHFATLERQIAVHPEWDVAGRESPCDPEDLTQLAAAIRNDFQQRFWNAETGRFVGWIDLTGRAYDYGFTFVNLEAIHFGLASADQADMVFAWLDGRRLVPGDTAQGDEVYAWRFAPRATTRRNIETYCWVWSAPHALPWGGQVQDGGAVLGFSFHDLMARLQVRGPDDAWDRLKAILSWYREVQAEGGYRAYYAKPGRGTLQGGGPAGGLGIDQEFLESVLVPQVMLYGFLGFDPSGDGQTAAGYRIRPQLPTDWTSLTIRGIRFREQRLNVTAWADGRVDIEDMDAAAAPK